MGLDWRDVAVVLLAILNWFLKDKLKTVQDSITATDLDLKKFKSSYYVKMEAH